MYFIVPIFYWIRFLRSKLWIEGESNTRSDSSPMDKVLSYPLKSYGWIQLTCNTLNETKWFILPDKRLAISFWGSFVLLLIILFNETRILYKYPYQRKSHHRIPIMTSKYELFIEKWNPLLLYSIDTLIKCDMSKQISLTKLNITSNFDWLGKRIS